MEVGVLREGLFFLWDGCWIDTYSRCLSCMDRSHGNRSGRIGGLVLGGAMVGEGGYIIAVWRKGGERLVLPTRWYFMIA